MDRIPGPFWLSRVKIVETKLRIAGVFGFWCLVAVIYLATAFHQRQTLNLSATAGGQFPYLACAERMAKEPGLGYLGDRNRMPLVPLLYAQAYTGDWEQYFSRSTWLAIVSSFAALCALGVVAHTRLSAWPATAWTLAAAFLVFLPKACFVQAELPYYALLFVLWLLLCRLFGRGQWWVSLAAGVLAALAYLTKASALATLMAFLAAWGFVQLRFLVKYWTKPDHPAGTRSLTRWIRTSTIVVLPCLVFVIVAFPYLADNKQRFGRYFYNVNSTFFMWCDNWPEAKAFADEFQIEAHYPTASQAQIPSPGNYWHSHSLGQISRRLMYGSAVSVQLGWKNGYLKYALLTAVLVGMAAWGRKIRAWELMDRNMGLLVFNVLFFGGYFLAYAWYAPIAFGDRFALSLFLPALYGLFRAFDWLTSPEVDTETVSIHPSWLRGGWFVVTALFVGEGVLSASGVHDQAPPQFVQFYFNESQVAIANGHPDVGRRGLAGVLKLDASFAPAHHELGMLAMKHGDFAEAAHRLARAVELAPSNANMANSLGSALIQNGEAIAAVAAFETAVELDPLFASGWFNLAGAYASQERVDDARSAIKRLRSIDATLADRLEKSLRAGGQLGPEP